MAAISSCIDLLIWNRSRDNSAWRGYGEVVMRGWVTQRYHRIDRRLVAATRLSGHRLFGRVLARLSLAQQFMIAALFVLLTGMFSSGWWLAYQIRQRVITRTVNLSSTYIESFVSPLVQALSWQTSLSAGDRQALDRELRDTPIGKEIVAFIVWGVDGRVLYSSDRTEIGKVFPIEDTLGQSWDGHTTWELVHSHDEEHIPSQNRADLLLAIYTPVHQNGSSKVVAVAEFYQNAELMESDIAASQHRTWLIIILVTLLMYSALVWFIRRASSTIEHQQRALSAQMVQNAELHERVRRAARRGAELNERFLRRLSAELHDGPAQYVGLSLLHLDRVVAHHEAHPENTTIAIHISAIQSSLQQAMMEVRSISAGLGLPELASFSLVETAARAIQAHELHTQTRVTASFAPLPACDSVAIKIALYRVVQEALSNAYHHAGGVDQTVSLWSDAEQLFIEVSDAGPGFDASAPAEWGDHMGLRGMRERVESLGGHFNIYSTAGAGTTISANLPLDEPAFDHE